MAYGYRVYSFKVTERNRREKSALELDGSRVPTLQKALCDAWSSTVLHDGLPAWRTLLNDMPTKGVKGDDRIRGIKAHSDQSQVHLEVHHGKIGQSPFLLPDSGDSQNISSGAPAHGLRHDFYFPTHGKQGILVAEVVSRHSALTPLLAWTSRLEGLDSDQDPKRWHRYRVDPLGDTELLESIIKNSDKATIEFKGNQVSASGRPGTPLELTLPVDGSNRVEVAKIILEWMKGNTGKPVNRMLTAIGFKPEKIGNAQLSFTMPKVRLRGEENITITPEDLDNIFTYTISDKVQPGEARWRSETGSKVHQLAEAWNIPLA